jgi:hypothetical protein
VVGDNPNQSALERANVVGDALGDEFGHRLVRDRNAVESGSFAENGDPRREVGRSDVDDQAGLEALAQSFLERDELTRNPVAREDELSTGLVQGVEGVEKLLFRLRLAGKELDVVDQEDIGVAIGVLEVLQRPRAQRGDEMVRERFDGRVANRCPATERADVIPDRGWESDSLSAPYGRDGTLHSRFSIQLSDPPISPLGPSEDHPHRISGPATSRSGAAPRSSAHVICRTFPVAAMKGLFRVGLLDRALTPRMLHECGNALAAPPTRKAVGTSVHDHTTIR